MIDFRDVRRAADPLHLRRKRRRSTFVSALAIGALTAVLWHVDTQTSSGEQRRKSIVEIRKTDDRETNVDFRFLSVTVFLTSGSSWSVPADCVKVAQVDCIGGGGGGARGGGGGGGGFARATNLVVTPLGSVSISVGAGGTGSLGPPGGTGGTTTFGSACSASGGTGGIDGTGTGAGGSGGAGTIGSTLFTGGAGSAFVSGGSQAWVGGAGGGAAGSTSNGSAGSTGTAPSLGGSGGAGGAPSGGAGGAGGSRTGVSAVPAAQARRTMRVMARAVVVGEAPAFKTAPPATVALVVFTAVEEGAGARRGSPAPMARVAMGARG